MKNKKIVSMAALITASMSAAQASTIADWNFDLVGAQPAGYNTPAASIGTGSGSALGMNNTYNGTNSFAGADVTAASGASTGSGSYGWRIRGTVANPQPNAGNGWSTQAPIGTQGAEFDASTANYQNISLSFDVDTTAQAERNLVVQYTILGAGDWYNATITGAGSLGSIANNTGSLLNTVSGSYYQLGSGWNNQITVNLSGVSSINNDPDFGIRLVNASTGTDDVNVGGTTYNNSSGNWRFDNVDISGTAVPEPATLALAGLGGLAALVAVRRRK